MLILVVQADGLGAFRAMAELELDGHTVVGPAYSSGEAIALARRRRPALALIDIDLESDDAGARLTRLLHEELDIPVIIAAGDDLRAREHADYAFGFLRKPFKTSDLPPLVDYASAIMRGDGAHQCIPQQGFELFDARCDAHALERAGRLS